MDQVKPRVLLADNYSDILKMLKTLCEQAGYDCDTASDGDEALAAWEKRCKGDDRYRMVILDAAMPGKTGFEVADYIRTNCDECLAEGERIPIVIVTGHPEPLMKPHARRVGAELMLKPIEPKSLTERLEEAKTASAR